MRHTSKFNLPLWDLGDSLNRADLNRLSQQAEETLSTLDRRALPSGLLYPDRVIDAAGIDSKVMDFFSVNSFPWRAASNGRQAVFAGSNGKYYYVYHYTKEKGITLIHTACADANQSVYAAVSIPENDDTIAYLYTYAYYGSVWRSLLYKIDLESGALTQVASASTGANVQEWYIASVRYALANFSFNQSGHTVTFWTQDLTTGEVSFSNNFALPSNITSMGVQDVHQDHVLLVGIGGNTAYVYAYNMATRGLNLVRQEAIYSSSCWCLYSENAKKWFLYFGVDSQNCAVYSWDRNTVVQKASKVPLSPPPGYYNAKPRLTTAFDPAVGMVLASGEYVHVFDQNTGLPIKTISCGSLSFLLISQVSNEKTVFLFNHYCAYALDLQTGDLTRLGSIPGYSISSTGFIVGNRTGATLVDGGKLFTLVKTSTTYDAAGYAPHIAATYTCGDT